MVAEAENPRAALSHPFSGKCRSGRDLRMMFRFCRSGTKSLIGAVRCCRSSSVNSFPTIQSQVDGQGYSKEKYLRQYQELVAQREKIKAVQEVGGAKLPVRERLSLLADESAEMLEIGLLSGMGLPYGDVPCAGNVVGVVEVSGELCVVSANDWTVKGGSSYPITVKKQLRAQEIALQNRLPCIYLVDSGGAFLPLQVCMHCCTWLAMLCLLTFTFHNRVSSILTKNTEGEFFAMKQCSLHSAYPR